MIWKAKNKYDCKRNKPGKASNGIQKHCADISVSEFEQSIVDVKASSSFEARKIIKKNNGGRPSQGFQKNTIFPKKF